VARLDLTVYIRAAAPESTIKIRRDTGHNKIASTDLRWPAGAHTHFHVPGLAVGGNSPGTTKAAALSCSRSCKDAVRVGGLSFIVRAMTHRHTGAAQRGLTVPCCAHRLG